MRPLKAIDASQRPARLLPAKSWCTLTLRAESVARTAPFAQGLLLSAGHNMAMGLSAETAESAYPTKVQLTAFLIDTTACPLARHSRHRSRRSRSRILSVSCSPSPRSSALGAQLVDIFDGPPARGDTPCARRPRLSRYHSHHEREDQQQRRCEAEPDQQLAGGGKFGVAIVRH
jgi:hypothetical protein